MELHEAHRSVRQAVADPARLAEVRATGLLDAGPQASLERYTRLARAYLGAPIALVTLLDADRQYFPAIEGLSGWAAESRQTPLSHSFCQHVVSDGILDVPDALEHPVLRHNLAVPDLGVRAYLGIPLISGTGQRLGALCTIDGEARVWTDEERAVLEDLAAAVSTDLQLRLAVAASTHQALHDALTGLPNRRQLEHDLDFALASRGDALCLALLDLDCFKAYNDAFGHPAGDDLLRRIAKRLTEQTEAAGGAAYRMGGDEFCLVVPAGADAEAIAATIAERTGPYEITASVGKVYLGVEATTRSEAMKLADERLYNRKRVRSVGDAGQASAALVQALAECHPRHGRHSYAVGQLAERVARRLGIEEGTLTEVRLAGELHDVGELAVPRSILDKPATLDDSEWAFVQRHTEVGERILAASPTLRHVAAAIRSTHERWDGSGYPDGLAGPDIPQAARIVFATDAYDAITTERPHRPAREHAEAMEELRSGAGTQFDPQVVAALERELLERPPAH